MLSTGPWLRRRWPTVLALVVVALMWGVDVAFRRDLLLVLPLVYVVSAAGRDRTSLKVQAIGMLVFGCVAVLAVEAAPEAARWLLAAG